MITIAGWANIACYYSVFHYYGNYSLSANAAVLLCRRHALQQAGSWQMGLSQPFSHEPFAALLAIAGAGRMQEYLHSSRCWPLKCWPSRKLKALRGAPQRWREQAAGSLKASSALRMQRAPRERRVTLHNFCMAAQATQR